MNSINLSKEDLCLLQELVYVMKTDGMDYHLCNEFLNILCPRWDVKSNFVEKGNKRLMFVPSSRTINGSFDYLEKWGVNNQDAFQKYYDIKDIDKFILYIKLFALVHEVEHSYQFLAAYDVRSTGSKFVDGSYKGIMDLMRKSDDFIPNPIKDTRKTISLVAYKMNQNRFFLERNANVDAFDFMATLVQNCSDEDMYQAFIYMWKHLVRVGYDSKYNGIINETYSRLLMADKLKKIYNNSGESLDSISSYDKVRFGLPISDETKDKVLKMKF